MGSTKTKRKHAGDKGAKRKRRKKARTEVSSSSESSSSENENEVVKKPVETRTEEEEEGEEEEKAEAPIIVDEDSDSDAEVDASAKFSKNGKIPPQLQDLHDSRADEKFQEYYMTYITREHADDLEKLRSAPDFTDHSLPLLIRALRSGVDIFNKEEKATIVGLAQAGQNPTN